MNVVAHGIDMVECSRIAESIERHGERFLNRVFTLAERDYCNVRKRCIEHLAGRFAAKEAVMKLLGTGWAKGVTWTDIEVRNETTGQPRIHLTGISKQLADEMGFTEILISISHVSSHAIASAIASTNQEQ